MGRIAFAGPFSEANFGDYAMLVNNISDMGCRDVVLYTYDAAFIEVLSARYLPEVKVEVIPLQIDFEKLAALPPNYAVAPFEIIQMIGNRERVVQSLDSVDLLVINGGGYFNDLWAQPHRLPKLLSIMGPALLADENGVSVRFTGNSYGPFNISSRLHSAFFNSLRNAEFGVRDELYSTPWLAALGVSAARTASIPDDLLFVNKGLLPCDERLFASPYVVLETYEPVESMGHDHAAYAEFVTAMRNRYGLDVVFMPLNLGRGGMDQALELSRSIPQLQVLDIRPDGLLPLSTAVQLIRHAEHVLSMRYHSLILALGNAVTFTKVVRPVLGDRIYYYNKDAGALRMAMGRRPVRDDRYFESHMLGAMRTIVEDLDGVRRYQVANYSGDYLAAMDGLRERRHRFLTQGLGGTPRPEGALR